MQIGADSDGDPIYGNAFYTMLFTLYSDGRELFVFIVPFIISFTASIFYNKYKKGANYFGLLSGLLFTWLFIFSIFQSMLQSHIVFLAFMYLIYLKNLATRKAYKIQ